MNAESILNGMKDRDQHNIGLVTMLMTDKSGKLVRLCACWPNVAYCLEALPLREECPDATPPTHREKWLWSLVEPEPEAVWAEVAGLPDAPHIRRLMATLQRVCAVFPDGTLSQQVITYLRNNATAAGVTVDEPL